VIVVVARSNTAGQWRGCITSRCASCNLWNSAFSTDETELCSCTRTCPVSGLSPGHFYWYITAMLRELGKELLWPGRKFVSKWCSQTGEV